MGNTHHNTATDAYYMHLSRQNQAELQSNDEIYTQTAPKRDVRHFRMTKQAKIRHCNVMREKVVEVPERLKVDGTNDPLAGDDADAIISKRMAESVNNRRTLTGDSSHHESVVDGSTCVL